MLEKDMLSKLLSKSLDILFLRHPIRTAFGFLIGYIIYGVVYSCRDLIAVNGVEVDSVHYVGCFVLGVLLMHVNTLIDAFNGTALDERLSTLLKTIENRVDLSAEQKRLMISSILTKEIESLTPQDLEAVEQKVTEK